MRFVLFTLLVLILFFEASGQIIKGQILDSDTNEPLVYVSIGVMNTTYGTISDNKGCFEFDVKGVDVSSSVRFSMIGYKPQKFSIEELVNNNNKIKMTKTAVEITEITIKPTSERKVGATSHNLLAGWSGWGGLYARKGYEIGTKIELGDKPVRIKSLHVMIHRQAFDTSFFRLHIRLVEDTLVMNELLTENIIIPVSTESGWVVINLEKYNIILHGDVGVTLEWLKVQGINTDREMKINDKMQKAYILFKNKKKHTGLYRWGTEAKWLINKDLSPGMFITIMEQIG